MKKLGCLLIGVTVACLTGCIESATVLKVKEDGSGTIMVREFYSPQITQMMAMGVTPEEGESGNVSQDGLAMFRDDIEKKAKSFGEGVELLRSEARTNDQGWKGYQATYAFADINALEITVGGGDAGGGGGMTMGEAPAEAEGDEEQDDGDRFRFAFTPGSPNSLQIIPQNVPEEAPAPAAETPAAPPSEEEAEMASLLDDLQPSESGASGDDSGEGQAEAMAEDIAQGMNQGMEQMAQGMGAMMAPMLKGMRISFIVMVDGKIVETNAAYPAGSEGNAVTVMDVPVDKIMGNPDAMAILTSEQPNMTAALAELGLSEIKLEEPGKTIELTFD